MQLVKWFTVVIPTFEYTGGEITPNIPFGAHVKGNMTVPSINPGDSVDGSLNTASEVDRYTIHLDLGDTYVFDCLGNNLDPMMSLSFRHQVVASDDDHFDLDPHIEYEAQATGTYELMVTGWNGDTGEYTLDIA
jgi:hypothetical protein